MSQEIVTVELPPPTVAPLTLLSAMIERNADPEALGKMIALVEQFAKNRAVESWAAAMCKCQQEMPTVVKNQVNSQTQSRYADLDEVQRVVVPCYTKHGFSLCFGEEDSPREGWTRVICDVTHRDGHTRRYHKDMPPSGEGIKGNRMMTLTHAAGSTSSYGRRYLTFEIFNLRVAGMPQDNDGNGAPPEDAPTITEVELKELYRLIDERWHATGKRANPEKFAAIYGGTSLETIPASRFRDAAAYLQNDIDAARKVGAK